MALVLTAGAMDPYYGFDRYMAYLSEVPDSITTLRLHLNVTLASTR